MMGRLKMLLPQPSNIEHLTPHRAPGIDLMESSWGDAPSNGAVNGGSEDTAGLCIMCYQIKKESRNFFSSSPGVQKKKQYRPQSSMYSTFQVVGQDFIHDSKSGLDIRLSRFGIIFYVIDPTTKRWVDAQCVLPKQ